MYDREMNKIRTMQITHDLAIGGLQQVVVNICRNIDRDKFYVTVLCLRALGEFVEEIENLGIPVILLPQKEIGTDYFSFIKVAKILRDEQIDVVHTHNTQPFIDGTIASLLTCVKKVIHTDHGRKFPDKKRYMLAEKIASFFVDRVVGVSEKTANDIIKYEHIHKNKVLTIFNGVDETRFAISVDKIAKKRELGIRNNGPIIGVASRLSPEKGVKYVISAMSEIIDKYPDSTLVIAGKGPQERSLIEQANKLNRHNNVLFIGARMDIPELLRVFDLIVVPSISEGLPMIILEAMAASCPVVATNVGGIPATIEHGENGSLVNPGDSKALSSEILRLLDDDNMRISYAENGLKLLREKYSAEIMTKKYEQLYISDEVFL